MSQPRSVLFDSFVVCVLLARFHFKIIRKSLYVTFSLVVLFFCLFFFFLMVAIFSFL